MLPQHRQFAMLLTGALLVTACSDAGEPAGPELLSASRSDAAATDRQIVVFRDDVADVPGLARRITSENGV